MAISQDTANKAISTGTSITSISTSFTLGSGADFLCVRPTAAGVTTGRTFSTVSWAGANITHATSAAKEQTDGAGDYFIGDIFYKVAPTTGTQTMVTTMSAAVRTLTQGWDSWTGVDSSTPVGTAATNSGTTANGSLTLSSATGEVCLAVLCCASSGTAAHSFADTTEQWETDEQTQIGTGANGASKAGAASVTMTSVCEAGGWIIVGIPIKPAASGSVIQSAGSSTVSLQGQSSATSALSAAGAGAATLRGQSSATAILTSAGTSSANFIGQAQVSGALSSAGTSTVNFEGASANTSQGALQVAGTSTVNFEGASLVESALQAAGTANVNFVGDSQGGGVDVTLWGRRYGEAERRKRIEEEDQLLEQFVREQLAPELIRRARARH